MISKTVFSQEHSKQTKQQLWKRIQFDKTVTLYFLHVDLKIFGFRIFGSSQNILRWMRQFDAKHDDHQNDPNSNTIKTYDLRFS